MQRASSFLCTSGDYNNPLRAIIFVRWRLTLQILYAHNHDQFVFVIRPRVSTIGAKTLKCKRCRIMSS